jgi:hypothetical protein
VFEKLKTICAAASLAGVMTLGAVPASAATNLVNNGDFETGDFTGWTLGPVSYPAEVVQWAAYEGLYGAQIAGYASGPNKLSQTLSTANGKLYDLSFWYLQDALLPNGLNVTWSGLSIFSSVDDVVGSWRYFSAQVLGSGSDQLLFTAYNEPAFTRVDNVSLSAAVSAVPEPATWAMMIIGFGAVGSMVRTSRRRNTFSVG